MSGSPTLQDFKAFFETYKKACREGDAAFHRALLPAGIPEDEFAFVVASSQEMMAALEASGVKPDFVKQNDRFDAVYQGDLGDGMTRMELDFYSSGGTWLKYDPQGPPEQQGFASPPAGADAPEPEPDGFTEDPGQKVRAPASTDRLRIVPLGYLASRDEPTGKDYAYAVWREEQADGNRWRLMSKGSVTAGTALDPAHPSFRSNRAKAAVQGLDHVLVGFSMAPKDDDPRKVELRVVFDRALEPQRVELRLVTRNTDGSAKEEQRLAFPWPAPEGAAGPPAPVLTAPKSTDAVAVEELAYLNAYDVIADKDYAYLVTKETRTGKGTWLLKIQAKSTAGASLDPAHPSFAKNIEAAAAKGLDHVVFGFRLEPKADDPRCVENRLYFDAAKRPLRVELNVVARDADGSAKPAETASFPWPA